MPIRPENKARYPRDWKTVVVPRIKARSGNRCECTGHCKDSKGGLTRCGVYNHEIGYWEWNGEFHITPPSTKGDFETDTRGVERKIIEIILTVAHLNHTPEDCRDENLLHLCQRCHNRYDAPVRAAGLKARRRDINADSDLFCEETT